MVIFHRTTTKKQNGIFVRQAYKRNVILIIYNDNIICYKN